MILKGAIGHIENPTLIGGDGSSIIANALSHRRNRSLFGRVLDLGNIYYCFNGGFGRSSILDERIKCLNFAAGDIIRQVDGYLSNYFGLTFLR